MEVLEDSMCDVIDDIFSCRDKTIGMDSDGELFKRSKPKSLNLNFIIILPLRSLAEVAGIYSKEFSHYEEVTRDMKMKVRGEKKLTKKK